MCSQEARNKERGNFGDRGFTGASYMEVELTRLLTDINAWCKE